MRFYILLLIPLSFILTGCPDSYDKTIRKIRQNNMDFTNSKPQHELGLGFNLSELFEKTTSTTLAFSSNKSVNYATEYNEILFSIEKMSDNHTKVATLMKDSDDPLDALRDYAVGMRANQYDNLHISEARELYSLTKKKGWLTLIQVENDYYSPCYLIATISYKGSYYIVQLSTSRDYCDYFYNDFLDIIKSIK